MNKKIIVTSLVIVALASSSSFANSVKKGPPKPETTENTPPLPQHPLTLPFNVTLAFDKISDDIVRNYEARRKVIADSEALEKERGQLQASRERFKKEPTYILSGKV